MTLMTSWAKARRAHKNRAYVRELLCKREPASPPSWQPPNRLSLSCLPMQVVLVFYREAWCPYRNLAPATYQTLLLPQLTDRGVALVAVSPQTPNRSLSTQEKRS